MSSENENENGNKNKQDDFIRRAKHPASSPTYRRKTGYVSDRHEYYSQYYQKNKAAFRKRRKERYHKSEAVREYHRKQSREWYKKHRAKGDNPNRTIIKTSDGRRLYSIGHAAGAVGFSIPYFRDMTLKGIFPDATYKNKAGWRMYSEDQIKLLKKAIVFYRQFTTPDNMQAVLYCYWDEPEKALYVENDALLIRALNAMKNKTGKQVKLKP